MSALWLMSLRVVVITILLVITVFIQYQSLPAGIFVTLYPLYIFIACVYFLTIIYSLLLRVTKDPDRIILLQIVLDPILVTVLICITGGISSPFAFLYLLAIMVASRFLYRRGGVIAASLSSILYGALLCSQYVGYIGILNFNPTNLDHISGAGVLYKVCTHIVAFYFIAFLSSYWSEQARKNAVELDRKQKNIWELEAFNRDIVQSINSGLVTVDSYCRITSFNRAAEAITAFSCSEAMGQSFSVVFPHLDLLSLGSDGSVNDSLSRFQYKNREGRELWLSFSISPLQNADHENIGQLILFQDMTRIKAMEDQISRNQVLTSIGQLSAAMAHEIRNPLASLTGCVQMLVQGISGNREKLMNIILRDAERLDTLMSDFLTYARPEDSKAGEIEVRQIVEQVVSNIRERAGQIGVQLLIDLEPPIRITMFPDHLSKIIENLVFRILETMPNGGKLEIGGRLIQDTDRGAIVGDGNFFCLLINYSGTDLFPSYVDTTDNPFSAIEAVIGEFGLAVVYRLVDYCGGKIYFKSQPSQGTTCHVYLPLKPA